MVISAALVSKIVTIGVLINIATVILKYVFVGSNFSMSNNIVSCVTLYGAQAYMNSIGSSITLSADSFNLDIFLSNTFPVLFLILLGIGMYFRDFGKDF